MIGNDKKLLDIDLLKRIKSPEQRWEEGIAHDLRSEHLFNQLRTIDELCNNDYHQFKSGGDGDNGETLMYLLDILYEYNDEFWKDYREPGGS